MVRSMIESSLMRLSLLALAVLLLCWPAEASAFTADKRDTLRGLTELSVLVEYLPDEIEREGMNRDQLKHDIELRLKDAGLRVLTTAETAKAPGAPYLYLMVYAVTSPSVSLHGYGVALLFKQLVQLSRYPATELFATTWEGPALPSVLGSPKAGEIRSRIFDAVERFLIDYRAVNQK
jgi:hypothetical protein